MWVLAHTGVRGNERVDELAKKALHKRCKSASVKQRLKV